MSSTIFNATLNGTLDTAEDCTFPAIQCPQNQPFTSANVFGTFLTLQFIQLTQPYGSLLFRGASGFWWRVNPIASLVEGIIIFWQLWLTPSRKQIKKYRWQNTAASLLLLRGVVRDEDDGLMTELLRGTFMDHEQREELLATVSEAAGRQEQSSSRADGPVQLSSEDPALNTSADFVSNPMPRRHTSQLEASLPSTERNSPQPRESRILNEAFGANALAHREWRIDLVTWLSVATIALKLVFVSGAVRFRIACFLMLVGWTAVQTLMILFHRREMSEESKKAAVRLTQALDKELDHQFWTIGHLVLHHFLDTWVTG